MWDCVLADPSNSSGACVYVVSKDLNCTHGLYFDFPVDFPVN